MLEGLAAYLPLPTDLRQAELLASALGVDEEIDDDTVLVISTSGTTGTPKGAQHTPETLTASAAATHEVLGGDGNWLLALPPHHIAGLQVLLRALGSGYIPVVLDLRPGFDPDALVAAIDELDGPRRYTSLVPTQLVKALDSPDAVAALKDLDAILIGGAATPLPLQARARDAGLPIVRTYGMSETAGGCVYDGIPLPGVDIRIDDPGSDGVGRVLLGGPMVAHGYRNLPNHPAFAQYGYFRTDDLGKLSTVGVLSIIGRADEAITSGGLTIVPQVVEAVILDDPSVAECAVVGVPDERLGEKVIAFVVAAGDSDAGDTGAGGVDTERITRSVADRLDRYAAPREVIALDALPSRGPGKVNRKALRENFVRSLRHIEPT